MSNSRLSSSGNVRPVRQGNTSQSPEGPGAQSESPQQTGQVVTRPQRSGFGQSVHQEMVRYVRPWDAKHSVPIIINSFPM